MFSWHSNISKVFDVICQLEMKNTSQHHGTVHLYTEHQLVFCETGVLSGLQFENYVTRQQLRHSQLEAALSFQSWGNPTLGIPLSLSAVLYHSHDQK